MQAELKRNEKYFRSLIENASDVIMLVDSDGIVCYVSPSIERVLGYEPDELTGQNVFDFVHPDDTPDIMDSFDRVLQNPASPTLVETRVRHKDGSWHIIEGMGNNLLDDPAVRGVVSNFRDITDRVRAQEALRHSMEKMARNQRLLLALSQAAQAVQRAHTPGEVYRTITGEIVRLGYHASIFTLSDDGTHLCASHLSFEPTLLRAAEKLTGLSAQGYRFPLVPGGFYQHIITERKAIFSDPAAGPISEALPSLVRPLTGRLAAVLRVGQAIYAPLVIGDETHGVLTVIGTDLTEADVPAMTTFANQAAIAIENAQLHAETQKRLQEQTALREASAVISSTLDLPDVLTHVAEQMSWVIDATSAYICSYDPISRIATVIAEYISPKACSKEQESDLGLTYLEDDPAFHKILHAGGHDISHVDDPGIPESERAHMQQYGAQSVLYIPLRAQDQPIGIVELWESRRRREFTPEEIALCQDIAQQAAVALVNARLYEQAQQEIRERVRAEGQIRASLREKEVLLQEIHHRVKNNLQVISSLLSLQSRYVEDQRALNILRDSQHRVRSMALIHEKLYRSRDLGRVNFAEYIQDLATGLIRSYRVSTGPVTLETNANSLFLGIGEAVPCGLIVNELVSNSLKHAFPPKGVRLDGRTSRIHIELGTNGSGQLTLVVSDNGIGFPEALDFRDMTSLGLQLVNTLVEQMGGSIELHRNGGTEFKITFAASVEGS